MVKHLLKTSSYVDNEAIIYCPQKNLFSFVKPSFPLTCPHCGRMLKKDKDVKLVLKEDFL